MKLIVISPPDNIPNEQETLLKLFEEGLEYFHLRKPEFSQAQYDQFLNKIPCQYREYIIIHHHHQLIYRYNLKGIHHTQKTNFQNLQLAKPFHQSKSFHEFYEIANNNYPYNYGFLSPIYNSISKSGYQSKFNLQDLTNLIKSNYNSLPIIALGGINLDKIKAIKQIGFAGVAILGAIWQEKEIQQRIENFKNIKNKIS
jgi:thiamine-phosphate pyrophosphorylase